MTDLPTVDIPAADTSHRDGMVVVDIDAMIAAKLAANVDKIEVVAVLTVFGVEWNLVEPTNAYTSLHMASIEDNPAALASFMQDLVHPDQRSQFRRTLMATPGLDSDVMLTVLNAMTEAVGKGQQERSVPSPATSSTRRGSRKSTAS